MKKSWLLKCGSDTVGTVIWDTFENWHNYGRLEPGPDYARYQAPFEQLWAAEQAWEELFYRDDSVPATELEQAEDRREKAEQALDQFVFSFEELDTHQVQPIYDFRPHGSRGNVYWRFGKLPTIRK